MAEAFKNLTTKRLLDQEIVARIKDLEDRVTALEPADEPDPALELPPGGDDD